MIALSKIPSPSARSLATEILFKVDTRKAYADLLIDQVLRSMQISERDSALLTELTYGTLRWRGTIDARLERNLRRPLAGIDPFIRNLLRLTAYQLLYLDRIPDYAAVNEAVELAKRRSRGAAGLVNAVLRNLLRDEAAPESLANGNSAGSLAKEYSHPEWLVERWVSYFGLDQARALMRANNEKPSLMLRVNTRNCSRAELLERFLSSGVQAAATPLSPAGIALAGAGAVEDLPGFSEGLFQVQGQSSQLVGFLLSPAPGERVLDACAAPGGKTTHLGELMKDDGEVVALDGSPNGIEKIRQNVNRLRLKSVRAVRADASTPLPEAIAAPYDRILVDAPCSGLGTLRRHPEIKWHREESDIHRLRGVQARILRRVTEYLKPGGVLVYSTCTLTHEENEQNIETFLSQHREFELEDAAGYLPPQAKHTVQGKFFQSLPHRDNTDGFFAARLKKSSG